MDVIGYPTDFDGCATDTSDDTANICEYSREVFFAHPDAFTFDVEHDVNVEFY